MIAEFRLIGHIDKPFLKRNIVYVGFNFNDGLFFINSCKYKILDKNGYDGFGDEEIFIGYTKKDIFNILSARDFISYPMIDIKVKEIDQKEKRYLCDFVFTSKSGKKHNNIEMEIFILDELNRVEYFIIEYSFEVLETIINHLVKNKILSRRKKCTLYKVDDYELNINGKSIENDFIVLENKDCSIYIPFIDVFIKYADNYSKKTKCEVFLKFKASEYPILLMNKNEIINLFNIEKFQDKYVLTIKEQYQAINYNIH